MPLIDHAAVARHWLATATALYDPDDLAAGIRIYRKGELAKVVEFTPAIVENGIPPQLDTIGIMSPGVGWIEAVPCPGFRLPQVDTKP